MEGPFRTSAGTSPVAMEISHSGKKDPRMFTTERARSQS